MTEEIKFADPDYAEGQVAAMAMILVGILDGMPAAAADKAIEFGRADNPASLEGMPAGRCGQYDMYWLIKDLLHEARHGELRP